MRQLVTHALQGSLANELCHQNLLGFVRELTVGVVSRADRQGRCQHVDQHVDLCTADRRDRDDLGGAGDELVDREQLRGHPVPGHFVDLGHDDHECRLGSNRSNLFDDPAVSRTDPLVGRNAQPDHVDFGVGVADQVVEPLAQQRARPVQTRGIDQNHLKVVAVNNAPNGVPSGLRSLRGDRHFGAYQRVGQRRLAGVRPADEAHKTRMEFAHVRLPAERAHSATFRVIFRSEFTFGVIAGQPLRWFRPG